MADSNKIDIGVNLNADKASGEARKLGKEVENAGRKAKAAAGGFSQATSAVSRFNNAIKAITNISFLTTGIASAVQLWEKLTAGVRRAKEEAAALALEQAKAADAAKVDKLAESYKKLGEAISTAAKARQRANELEDLETSEADRLADEEAKLQKAKQIAELDPSDPAYVEKRQRIENEYEVASARRGVERAKRDAETKERREYAEEEAAISAAAGKRLSLVDDRAELESLRSRADEARRKSEQGNEFDANSFGEYFLNNLKSILSFDGKHFGSDRTAAGDEERKRQQEEAKRLDELAKALEGRISAKESEISGLDAEASHHYQRAGVFAESAANTAVAEERVNVSGNASTAASEKAVSDKEAAMASALAASVSLKAQKSSIKEQMAEQQGLKDAASQQVFEAQNALDLATANGDRAGMKSAGSALAEAKTNAQNVDAAADRVLADLAKSLKNIEQRLNAASNYLKQQNSQSAYAWAESPAGGS